MCVWSHLPCWWVGTESGGPGSGWRGGHPAEVTGSADVAPVPCLVFNQARWAVLLSYSVSWSQEGQSVLVWPWTDVLGAGWGQLLAHALSLEAQF